MNQLFRWLGCSLLMLATACQQTATRPAAAPTNENGDSAPWTVNQVIQTIAKPPPVLKAYSPLVQIAPSPEFVTIGPEYFNVSHILRSIGPYHPEMVDYTSLRVAFHNTALGAAQRLCVARYLLEFRDSEAQKFVIAAVDGMDLSVASDAILVLENSSADASTGDWSIDQMLSVIQDVTPMPASDEIGGKILTRAETFCESICSTLGELHIKRAVPVLLRYLHQHRDSPFLYRALGEIGDPAAIPALVKIVEYQGRNIYAKDPDILETVLDPRAAEALQDLQYSGLDAILLRHLDNWEVISLLNRAHDPGTVPALEAWLRTHDAPEIRICIALNAAKDNHDEAVRLCALLDTPLDWKTQYDILHWLAETKDPIGVAHARRVALTAPATEPGDDVVYSTMEVMKAVHNDEAVEALIAMLERDYSKFRLSMFSGKVNAEIHRRVRSSLVEITGQNFDADAALWRTWFNATHVLSTQQK